MNKKQKKAFEEARYRKLRLLRRMAMQQKEAHEAAVAADYELFAEQQQKSRKEREERGEDADQPWTARTQMIRNKLTNQRRQSMDRWNRFSGTAAAGGMGR